jgi:uncharacterized protein YcaQ
MNDSNKMLTLSNKEARHLILASQGLLQNFFGDKKEGTLKVIEHLGYVQIDTISVVERAHHHTIWTRVEDYRKNYLTELVEQDKTAFEYWSHAAAFLPMSDFRFSLVRKHRFINAEKKWFGNKKILKFVYDRIVAEGPLQSKDFEEKKKKGGWWEWKDTKRALEQLFMEGRLMAAKRQGFQKVYDITERVLPAGVNSIMPTEKEYAGYLIQKVIRSNGLAAPQEIGYLRTHTKGAVIKLLKEMQEDGEISPVKVQGLSGEIFYTTQQNLNLATRMKIKKEVKILSPFDNLVIQRSRLKKIFGFDYTIECYVPEAKRKYGYFCLPVLYGDEFVGRMDCKAERSDKVLSVRNIFYEKKFAKEKKLQVGLEKALKKFSKFNGCEKIVRAASRQKNG